LLATPIANVHLNYMTQADYSQRLRLKGSVLGEDQGFFKMQQLPVKPIGFKAY